MPTHNPDQAGFMDEPPEPDTTTVRRGNTWFKIDKASGTVIKAWEATSQTGAAEAATTKKPRKQTKQTRTQAQAQMVFRGLTHMSHGTRCVVSFEDGSTHAGLLAWIKSDLPVAQDTEDSNVRFRFRDGREVNVRDLVSLD